MSILGRPKRKQDIKKRAIKKFADSYRVGIAYMGLAELKFRNKNEGSDYDGFKQIYRYQGSVNSKDSVYGEITASVELKIRQKRYTSAILSDWNIFPPSEYNNRTQEQYDVLSHNIEGMISNEFSARIDYLHYDEIAGEQRFFYYHDVGTYYSIEDVLDAISTESEVAWGEVAIKLREYAENLNYHRSTRDYFPDTIELSVPEKTLVLDKRREGNWRGECHYRNDGIWLNVYANINAIPYNDEGELVHSSDMGYSFYHVSRDDTIGGYHVEVGGTIVDENTQVSEMLCNPRFDEWTRRFKDQGAETLEGAKAIAEANVRELYQEFTDYLNSERNYVTQSNGRGYARTTENPNEWNYNFGDTWDDIRYENWDDERDEVWDRYWNSQPAYNYKWASAKKSKSVPQFSTVVAKLRKKE